MQDVAQEIAAVLRAIIVLFVALLVIVSLSGVVKSGVDWAMQSLL